MKNSEFNSEEIEQLRQEIDDFVLLMKQEEYRLEIGEKSILFLKERNFYLLDKIISNSTYAKRSFSFICKFSLSKKKFFGPCEVCILKAYLVIIGVIGKTGAVVSFWLSFIDKIIEQISSFFNQDHKFTKRLLTNIESIRNNVSPHKIARLVCINLGNCDQ